MKLYRKIAYLLILLCFTTVIAQEATCAAIVQQAMSSVEEDCAPTGRNQACYGYVSLEATPRDTAVDFTFSQEGDLANVADIDTLRLSRLDEENNTWGIALMKLQANLPDTLPGQNVTFLLFGDVQIQNAVQPGVAQATVGITSNGNVNIRNSPSTNGSVIGSLGRGEAAAANGRNADSTWLRIQIPDSDALGWVFAELVTPATGVSDLAVVDSTEAETPFTPMQAFYFQTGITQTNCAAAPADGILIQTPEGVGKVNLRANDVDIQLGSTGFFQAQPGVAMTVSVLEGEGEATANGETVVIPAGSQVSIPVDDNLHAVGAPSEPEPYDEATASLLPVEVLPEQIAIAPPLSQEQIEQVNATPTPGGGGGFPDAGALGLDPSMFEGMGGAMFCSTMNQAFASMGMTKEQYLAQIQPMLGMVPADTRAQFEQFMQMLNAC